MKEPYTQGTTLPFNDSVQKRDTHGGDIYFSKYPILTENFSLYTPPAISAGEAVANNAVNIGAQITKPVTIALFVVSAPVAIALLKILQALEFLQFINV